MIIVGILVNYVAYVYNNFLNSKSSNVNKSFNESSIFRNQNSLLYPQKSRLWAGPLHLWEFK